ncbi:MAG: NPCBM/NEW2 domain-containing protein [Planctomycetia bacterium]|nr:NPCBM/NEW2 domain-containing protein [Planctomycetia bacterium]
MTHTARVGRAVDRWLCLIFALLSALPLALRSEIGYADDSQFQPASTLWLDELDLRYVECGFGEPRARRTTYNHELVVVDQKFERGLGWHAPGSIVLQLPQCASRFHCSFGISDETNGAGKVELRVYADGDLLWRSGFLTGEDRALTCDVELSGRRYLVLIADMGENYNFDHIVLADARLELASDAPEELRAVKIIRPVHLGDNGVVYDMDEDQNDPEAFERLKEYASLCEQISAGMRENVAATARDQAATIQPSDRDPLDLVVRRVSKLLTTLQEAREDHELDQLALQWQALCAQYDQSQRQLENAPELRDLPETVKARYELFKRARQLRRQIAFKNPLLDDFSEMLFIKRHYNPEPEREGNHMVDQFFGFHARPGGGLFLLKNPFSDDPELVDVLKDSVVANGRLKGVKLDSTWGFLAPHLAYDGKTIYFSAADTKNPRHAYEWTQENAYHIFRVNLDGSELTQLTDGPWDDIDPCLLPNGRVAFISERRGGYGRCHARPCPSYTLHSMNPDGSDIVALSVHETNEWAPTVDHNGMIVYTRWDYVDRGFNQAHHPWITFPDGRDSRAIQGNYSSDEHSRPHFETSLKPIPDSNLFVGIASGHHTQNFGSVILLDPMVEDDDVGNDPMAPIRRVTPEQLFPEAEIGTHGPPHNYGQPYPLSEDFFLVVYDAFSGSAKGEENNYSVYLLDSFGNKDLIYRDPAISCQHPIPVMAREVPPVIPNQTYVGLTDEERARINPPQELPTTATVGLVDVYKTTRPFPEGAKIKELRIVQLLPKTTVNANMPWIGFGGENSARKVLGTVPVEEDGSARFDAPVNVPFYIQALDENGVAVQTMRSATYVHPGETLTCLGCHEGRFNASQNANAPIPTAFTREPSKIEPEMVGTNPMNYPRLIQPILDKHCAQCHEQGAKEGKTFELGRGPEEQYFLSSYINLRPYVYVLGNGNANPDAPVKFQPHGGAAWNSFSIAKTMPGEFGANRSELWKIIKDGHYDVKLSPEELRAFALWMDNNCDFFGAYEMDTLQAQRHGEIVQSTLE